ncbi:MAG: NAD(P)H-dependent oxidoreductase subunit E, partial [Myxococcales bacterium]|nr:NAD(P)H-dependent oxidoreductase subunit E [Myxococcales bacterium]
MDLKPIAARATDVERDVIDGVVGAPAARPETVAESSGVRHLLLPTLHAIQGRFGWISPGALGYACERLGVPPAEGYGVATFYALFALAERPPTVVHVCDDIACKAAGAEAICNALASEVGEAGTRRGSATWLRSPCLGLCEQAPAAMIVAAGATPVERAWGQASARDVVAALDGGGEVGVVPRLPIPQRGDPSLRLLRRVGVVDPTSLDEYRAHGGYAALRVALEMGAAG